MNRFALPRGFTIVELLVTLAIAAILLAVAVPSFTLFAQSVRSAKRPCRCAMLWSWRGVSHCLNARYGPSALWMRQIAVSAAPVCGYWFFATTMITKILMLAKCSTRILISTPLTLKCQPPLVALIYALPAMAKPLESGNLEVCSTNQAVDYGRQAIVFRSGRIRLSSDSDGDGYDDAGGTKIECHGSLSILG